MTKQELFDLIKGTIVVSCQATPGEPLYMKDQSIMYLMARAAKQAGAKMIRTSSMREVDECMEAMADIVSIDCTFNERADGLTPGEFLKQVKAKYPNIIIMADCATLEEAVAAYEAGADLVGSTMNGYTPQTRDCKGDPNYELVRQMVAALPCPVIAEGRVHTPEQARKMLEIGAWAVVVGGAITRPLEIANRFMAAVKDFKA